MDHIHLLEELGLTEKEAKIYMACLEMGQASATGIAKKTRIPKSSVYDILDSLKRKGYIVVSPKKGKQYFSASAPLVFKERVKKQEESLDTLLPHLNALYRSDTVKPKVRFFETEDALRIINNEMLEEATEMLAISSQEDVEERFHDFFRKVSPQLRLKKKLPLRIIFRESNLAYEYKAEDYKYLRQSKIIPKDSKFSGAVWIWKNKVVTFSFKKKFTATVIEDPEIYEVHKVLFESMWKYHPEVKR